MEPFSIGYSATHGGDIYFKGSIADIKLWDRCLSYDEVKNLHKETPSDNLILSIDFSKNLDDNDVLLEADNVEFIEDTISIPHTILPYRRDGKFRCLPHQTEGLINEGGIDKWAKGETTARNERRYVLQMQQGKIDYKLDGINNMNYEYINTDIIFDKHKMINVKTK
jgi:hypothetical protein